MATIEFPKDTRKWTLVHRVADRYPKIADSILEVLDDYAAGGVIRESFTDVEIIEFFFKTYPQLATISRFGGWQKLLKKVRNGEVTFKRSERPSKTKTSRGQNSRRSPKAK